jgi:hypothetical protein
MVKTYQECGNKTTPFVINKRTDSTIPGKSGTIHQYNNDVNKKDKVMASMILCFTNPDRYLPPNLLYDIIKPYPEINRNMDTIGAPQDFRGDNQVIVFSRLI